MHLERTAIKIPIGLEKKKENNSDLKKEDRRIIAGIAHDINNLLSVVLYNIDFIRQDKALNKALNKELQDIDNATKIAGNLVTQLMHINSSKPPKAKRLNANAVISDALQMLRRILGDRVKLNLNLADDLKDIIVLPDHVHRMMLNLAINARDAIEGEGHLTIETRNVSFDSDHLPRQLQSSDLKNLKNLQPFVHIRVSDSGKGMNEETQEHAFKPYYTAREDGCGNGLGLYLVYEMVLKNKGYITLESEPDMGCMFDIYLPAVTE